MHIIPFVNRVKEQEKLIGALTSKFPTLIILYGRRRIGKSELIKQVLSARDIYFLSTQIDISQQLSDLAITIDKTIEGFSNVIYPNISVLLETLSRQLKEQTTIVIDEFNYLIESNKSILSEINRFWENGNNTKLNIILCGSATKLMEKIASSYKAPLYGRTDIIMNLHPIYPGWMLDALDIDSKTAVELYSVLGGTPKYWETAKKFNCLDIDKAVKKLFLEKDSPLQRESSIVLYDDLKNATQYYSILSALNNKMLRAGVIANKLHIEPTSLTRPLKVLQELKFIEREVRFLDNPQKAKNTLYKITDPFLSFYFNFVQKYRSELEMELSEEVFTAIHESLICHISATWEKLCRMAVPYIKSEQINWKPAQRWWGTGIDKSEIEVDVLSLSFCKKYVLAGEVKWSDSMNVKKELYKLKNKILKIPSFPKNKRIKYILFARDFVDLIHDQDLLLMYPNDVLNNLK